MQVHTLSAIQQEIQSYKRICATERKLEADFMEPEKMTPSHQEQLRHCKERRRRIENWLSLLNDDELFVVQRRLIDEVIWSQLQQEYADRDGTFPKARRTLMRYQNRALKKIACFLNESG